MRTVLEIGAAVREARERLGLSRSDLGNRIGLDQETIKKIESGERVKQWLRVAQLAEALHVTPNALLGFPVLQPAALESALRPILVAFGQDPQDADSIARILLEAVEDAQSLDGDEPEPTRFRHAGAIAAARFRRRNSE